MNAQAEEGKKEFRLTEALSYLANMRTFWMITVGLGEHCPQTSVHCHDPGNAGQSTT